MINQSELKHYLTYDTCSGIFTWNVSTARRIKVGDIAGGLNSEGYVRIRLRGKWYLAHRLAWLYTYGEFPSFEIDHINGNPSDNSITNLRNANRKQNMENQKLHKDNRSGHRGVSFVELLQKWRVRVTHQRQIYNVGYFDKLEDAVNAAKTARDSLFTHHLTGHSA